MDCQNRRRCGEKWLLILVVVEKEMSLLVMKIGKNAVSLVSVDGRLPIWPRFLRGTKKI